MCLRLLVRLEQSEEGERQGMQSEWQKIVTKSRQRAQDLVHSYK